VFEGELVNVLGLDTQLMMMERDGDVCRGEDDCPLPLLVAEEARRAVGSGAAGARVL
jgi:hypothetical protein